MKAPKRERALNADQLGAKGEARFGELCEDAKLVCNKSNRDRTGWDFLVEFPFDLPASDRTLDKRGSATSCHVQLKTIWSDSKRIVMRLSSAERLAKEPKPTFVYVLMVDDALDIVDSYLIHLRGTNLARILKRLRSAQAAGELQINDAEITFGPRTAGVRVPPNGKALREQLVQDCGENPQAYIASKARELAELGFEKARYHLKVSLEAQNKDELVDAFLGLRPIEGNALEHTELRFGVALPVTRHPPGHRLKFEFLPRPADTCTIRAFGTASEAPAVFQGEAFFPLVPAPDGHFRARLRTVFFTVDYQQIAADGQGQTILTPLSEINNGARFGIEEWKNFFRLLIALGQDQPTLEIAPTVQMTRFSIPVGRNRDIEQLAIARELLRTCDGIDNIFELSGVKSGPVSLQELITLVPRMLLASSLLACRPEGVPVSFSTPHQSEYTPIRLLYVDWMEVAKVAVAYGAVVTMGAEPEDDHINWRPLSVAQPRVYEINGGSDSYRLFIEAFKVYPSGE